MRNRQSLRSRQKLQQMMHKITGTQKNNKHKNASNSHMEKSLPVARVDQCRLWMKWCKCQSWNISVRCKCLQRVQKDGKSSLIWPILKSLRAAYHTAILYTINAQS